MRFLYSYLTAIPGREAMARKRWLTMDELSKENKKFEFDFRGLKTENLSIDFRGLKTENCSAGQPPR